MTDSAPAPEFSRHADQDALIEAARTRFVDVVCAAQGDDGMARIAVTGGGAGIGLLAALAEDSGAIDWTRVMVFFGDERFVPEESPDRNVGQARKALFDHVDIPGSYIFPIAPSGGAYLEDPVCAADAYADILAMHAPDGFDLHLLGMGPEGHVNSLFPGTPAIAETERTVVEVRDCPKPPPTRVSLTLPAINASERVWLLVSGEAKAEAVKAIADGADPADWPAAGVRGTAETIVFVDEAAASKL
ncbi:6-phosphogluconolactonase [Corynebacterium hansenii]|uniref:6-phosphogluconolactonase n=1 Tax=Corynebacterium hansenii TaxID=394964 RepID=A0ABV7ZUF1_9CORY|nr:6-phosphogluconolactonase [Corynebacterium hansenii]WJY99965.1 6-phosphogluconolactonase [Corynebacterium hansenii]